jgi:Cu+-exporting ATPase
MAEKIEIVVLDKTGTITQGKPVVQSIQSLNGRNEEQVLRLAASAEQYSEHPIARAIVSAAKQRGLVLVDPDNFANQPGSGVVADIEGQRLLVGSESMVSGDRGASSVPSIQHGPDVPLATGTVVHIAIQRDHAPEPIGIISLVDQIKPDSARAIEDLHRMNLKTVLLSGDNERTAQAIAGQVGIDDVRANVKPDGKATTIRELQQQKSQISDLKSQISNPEFSNAERQTSHLGSPISDSRSYVAMVGDGINDAPALAQADLGVAIGSGSDIAKETGGIVLVGGSLHGIATAIRLSRATMRKIRQNLFFAFIYNVLAIPLAAAGLLNPYVAAAAMALSDVTVIGNALLLRREKID